MRRLKPREQNPGEEGGTLETVTAHLLVRHGHEPTPPLYDEAAIAARSSYDARTRVENRVRRLSHVGRPATPA